MLKKISVLTLTTLIMTGCTREVYLQEVPCFECEPCPCTELTPECCPEVAMQTEIQHYQVYDAPVVQTCGCQTQINTCQYQSTKKNCRVVCRQRQITE